jgi:hypothetical protein
MDITLWSTSIRVMRCNGHHVAYVSWWDAHRNEILTNMHCVSIEKKYMIWYISITRYVITLDPEHGSLPKYTQYK